jgi:hypothetical protein
VKQGFDLIVVAVGSMETATWHDLGDAHTH